LLAPKQTMNKAAGVSSMTSVQAAKVPNPKPKTMPVGKITKSEDAPAPNHWISHESGHEAGITSSRGGQEHAITIHHKRQNQLDAPNRFPHSQKHIHYGSLDSAKSHAHKMLGHFADINKALEAGSSLTSPANLSGGAALGKESLEGKMHKGGQFSGNVPKDVKIKELQGKIDSGKYKPDPKAIAGKMLEHKDKPLKKLEVLQKPYVSDAQRRWAHTDSGMEALGGKAGVHEWDEATKGKKLPERKTMKKSEALQRAESEYASWEKREEFEKFMKSRMPHMTKGEIIAFGQAMLLNKSSRMEKSLNGLLGLLKEEPKK